MKNGIYGFHYQGMYHEALFHNDKIINAFCDYYSSEIELSKMAINIIMMDKNIYFKKVIKNPLR